MNTSADLASIDLETPFRVTDLKQWVYCPRVLYYHTCLPDVRPTTYKMEVGIRAGEEEARREMRRSLRTFGLENGHREFDLQLETSRLGLRGTVDMVIWTQDSQLEDAIPVDYKLSKISGAHFKLQIMAYGLLLEDQFGVKTRRGFLYLIPTRKAVEVRFDNRLRRKLLEILDSMHQMLGLEMMPEPAQNRRKCLTCEFRRFCNDIF